MWERSLVSRVLFPVPRTTYSDDSFPDELIWVPKVKDWAKSPDQWTQCSHEDRVPCLLLTCPSARFLVIFFHSNAEDLGRCRPFCAFVRDQFQVHVLAVEYPGYGICPGTPTGESVVENAFAAFHFVRSSLRIPMDSIKVFGRSIGTGPAIRLASMFSLAGLILVTPFLSVKKLFQDRVGPLASFVDECFENEEAVKKITSPTMIIHGMRDKLIFYSHSELLYGMLTSRKLLISPPTMEHNSNLLSNIEWFVLPMFQFFALPDYAFQEVFVPKWAYDRRGVIRDELALEDAGIYVEAWDCWSRAENCPSGVNMRIRQVDSASTDTKAQTPKGDCGDGGDGDGSSKVEKAGEAKESSDDAEQAPYLVKTIRSSGSKLSKDGLTERNRRRGAAAMHNCDNKAWAPLAACCTNRKEAVAHTSEDKPSMFLKGSRAGSAEEELITQAILGDMPKASIFI